MMSPEKGVCWLVMGVSGSGKSTIGRQLAATREARFLDADTLHSPRAKEKMSRGEGLTDTDRLPWLNALADEIAQARRRGEELVVACSALKLEYRNTLIRASANGSSASALSRPASPTREQKESPSSALGRVNIIYLKVPSEVLATRLAKRQGHFAGPGLLQSQLETLEEPGREVTFDGAQRPEQVMQEIVGRYSLETSE
ncbi:MAG: AAA family ATPase [Polyangiaceae bacterium]|nr:AAA family ATPase [Polyangiaceae bacterium]